jgi:hypothetical protein
VLNGASFDEALIEPHIIKSQIKYIKDSIGEDLYDDLVESYDTTATVTLAELNLIQDYIQPALARFVTFEALPFIRQNITSAGVVLNNPEFSDQSSSADFGMLRSAILSDAEFYRNLLVEYLKDNETDWPLFENCDYKKRSRPGIIIE